uniref:Uncharacterized protein n=1 Tax=Glossina austeni TaxID=7395 RepID=A0A1A9VE45_GLOAU
MSSLLHCLIGIMISIRKDARVLPLQCFQSTAKRDFPNCYKRARYAQEIVKPVNRREAHRRGGVQRISGAIYEETQACNTLLSLDYTQFIVLLALDWQIIQSFCLVAVLADYNARTAGPIFLL